ncbi:MAG TPA: hypothetical protein VFO83_16970 [Aggregicoccus sp.]|nr:hypothetical protein [Aggregicoccus sp.]
MREDRWLHMVHAALLLEEQLVQEHPVSAQERRRRVELLLGSLLEVFPSSLDPVDDFEGFAVRKLAQALQRALE